MFRLPRRKPKFLAARAGSPAARCAGAVADKTRETGCIEPHAGAVARGLRPWVEILAEPEERNYHFVPKDEEILSQNGSPVKRKEKRQAGHERMRGTSTRTAGKRGIAGSAPARLAGAVRNAAGAPMMADVPMVLLAGGIVLLVLPLAAVADIMTVDLGERGHRAAQNAAFASLRPSKALGASWVGGSRGRKAPCSGQLRRPVGIFDLSCATTLFHLTCRVPQQRPRTPVTQQPRELNHGLPRFAAS